MSTSPIMSALSLAAATTMALMPVSPLRADTPLNVVSYVKDGGSGGSRCESIANACSDIALAVHLTQQGGQIVIVGTAIAIHEATFILKSVSITNDGGGTAITTPDAPFSDVKTIRITAGPGDVVSLRGLIIDGGNFQTSGIDIEQASAVHIQKCVVRNYQAIGAWSISDTRSTGGKLFISDTLIDNNGSNAASGGILLQPTGTGSLDVVLDRVHLENNVVGLWADGRQSTGNGVHAVIRDSVVSGNDGDGIFAGSAAGKAPAFVAVQHTSAVGNAGVGIHADGPHATIVLDENFLTRNGSGISAGNSGQLISFGNNRNFNNLGAEGEATSLFAPK